MIQLCVCACLTYTVLGKGRSLKTFKIYLIQFHIELSSLPLILLITATKKRDGGPIKGIENV